jgi:hypothetical protein
MFVGLDEEKSLQKKGGYPRRIACWHFECCCPAKKHEDHLTRATRNLHTSFKVKEVDSGIFGHLL